jgi:restriction system protein
MIEQTHKVRTPDFPLYSEVRQLLTILQGVPRATVTKMNAALWEQMGTPQNPVDWSEPATWIDERLKGDQAKLAWRIWEESQHTVNPRYIYGSYFFINTYKLLVPDAQGAYQISAQGKAFLTKDLSVIRQLDEDEGLLQLLTILSTKKRAKRADLLPEWSDFLHAYSRFAAEAPIKETLLRRLGNLVERSFVLREGNTYTISQEGMDYISSASKHAPDPRREMLRAIQGFNEKEREVLRKRLSTMSPYLFEQLIGQLLEAMGYEDVKVTKAAGDQGVDVIARAQFGITTVTEVVQVKRHQGTIGRPLIDQLRGALPLHRAIRGTLITLSKFAAGCTDVAAFPGAAPITLIDGEKLMDLLIEHQIGLRQRPVMLYEMDEEFFQTLDEHNQLGAISNGEAGIV